MRLITTECTECGHRQEDLVGRLGDPDFEPCEKCGCVHMAEVKGEIVASSCQKHRHAGAGPWG